MYWRGNEFVAKRPQVTIGRSMIVVAFFAMLFALPSLAAAALAGLIVSVVLAWGSLSILSRFVSRDSDLPAARGDAAAFAIIAFAIDVAAWLSIVVVLNLFDGRTDSVGCMAVLFVLATIGMFAFVVALAATIRRVNPDEIGWKVLPIFVVATSWPFCLGLGFALVIAVVWVCECIRWWAW
jgi:hypothetical protein